VQIEFNDTNARYALLQAVFENVTASQRNGSLRFWITAGDRATERLRLDANGVGFNGAKPSQPVLSYSRLAGGETPALESIRLALAKLGLVLDQTT
jgi:hypothetical protein